MKQKWQKFFVASSIIACSLAATASQVRAQIASDGTQSTAVTTADNLNFTITGGSQAGANLFHSLREFSIPTGGSAFFNNAADIQNIFSRVTGNSLSNIDGLIRANGTANLFLLNPNGIVFGPNARLNIGGSFLGTTANAAVFEGGLEFSTSPAAEPILSVNIPVGLQFRENSSASIINQSIALDRNNIQLGLQVNPGSSLTLLGGDVLVEGGVLSADSGRIELGSVGSNSLVSLIPIERGYALGYAGVVNFQDIGLSREAFVRSNAGDIQVRGRRITLAEGAQISASTAGAERGGTLNVIAAESVELAGVGANIPTGLFAAVLSDATGAGGNLTIETERLIVRDGAQISTSTFGAGNGGSLILRSAEVALIGTTADGLRASGLFATAAPNSIGAGGDLTIESDRLLVIDGAQVGVTAFSSGRAGNLTVRASEIELNGAIPVPGDDPTFSGLFAGTDEGSPGAGGNLTIETERLTIRNGAEAQVSTLGDGDAGTLTVRASESVELIGSFGNFPSALLAVSGLEGISTTATGRGGNLIVETPRLIVSSGAEITASADGTGDAGELRINARDIRLENQGRIRAETATGAGGNIALQVRDLQLRGNSSISTTAGSAAGPGDGGNININTETLAGIQNSDITANAFQGRGGQISIQAEAILGLQNRQQLTPENDITAFSQQSPALSGTVELDSLEEDPASGLAAFPDNTVDPEDLISQNPCEQGQGSEFIVTGRGGLPPDPTETINSDTARVGLVEPIPFESFDFSGVGGELGNITPDSTLKTQTPAIIPARGMITNQLGEVVLTAYDPTGTLSQRDDPRNGQGCME